MYSHSRFESPRAIGLAVNTDVFFNTSTGEENFKEIRGLERENRCPCAHAQYHGFSGAVPFSFIICPQANPPLLQPGSRTLSPPPALSLLKTLSLP